MSKLSEGLSKFFKPKSEKLKKEKAAKELGIPVHILEMPEGRDKEKAIRVHLANEKEKARKERDGYSRGGVKSKNNYECGGVKYSKLKDYMKKGKKK